MVKHTKGFKGLSKKVLSAILAASMIMTSSSFVMAAEPTDNADTAVVSEVESNQAENGRAGADDLQDYNAEDFTVSVAPATYNNGKELKPKVTVQYKGTPLNEGTDYTVAYSNNKDAGEKAQYTVMFQGDYVKADNITGYFTIAPVKFSDLAEVKVEIDPITRAFVYNGKEQYPEVQSVKVKFNADDEEYITLNADEYSVRTVSAAGGVQIDLVNAGKHSIMIDGEGNYTGSVEGVVYEIQQAPLDGGLVSVTVPPIVYDNSLTDFRDQLKIVDTAANEELSISDFYVSYWNEEEEIWQKTPELDIGTHKMRIESNTVKNFTGNLEFTYEIVASDTLAMAANNAVVAGQAADEGVVTVTYDGNDQYVAKENIELKGLKQDVDYKVVTPKAEWVDAGEYTIELEGLNKYAGQTATVTLKVNPKSMVDGNGDAVSNIEVVATQGTHPGSGELADVVVKVTDKGIVDEDGVAKVLVEGTDYTYEVKTVDGDTVVEITGIGNYTTEYDDGSVLTENVVVDEEELDLNDPSISVEVEGTYNYTGKAITLKTEDIIVTENDNGKVVTLEPHTNYEIKADGYENNTNAGTAIATIVGKDGYTGEREVTFTIKGTSFADTFDIAEIDDVKKGSAVSAVEDAVKVTYKSTGATYRNYEVDIFKDGEKYEKATFEKGGVYTVVVTSKDGRFEGTLETTVNVVGDDLKDLKASIAAIDDQVYTGEEIKPAVVVTVGKETLKEGEDYTVAYSNNVNAGSADVVVTGINEYSGTIDTTFDITKGQQTIEMTNPLQVKDLGNGSRATNSKNCTLKLGFGLEDKVNLSYSSDNEDVATVANGVITYQGVGECTITVTAKETDNCLEYSLPIKVVVGKVGTPTFTPSVTSKTAKKSITVTSSTVRGADGFEVQYSVRSDWWRASTVDFDGTTNGKLYRQTIKTYHSNKKYYIRVRAYQVVDGVKQYSDWSPAKTATTK